MNPIDLFFSFSGRIGRAHWWLGLIVILGLGLIVAYVDDPTLLSPDEPVQPTSLFGFVASLLLIPPDLAVQAKRFNDRDQSIWLMIAYGFFSVAVAVLDYLELLFSAGEDFTFRDVVVAVVVVAVIVALVINNGIIKGTDGPNQHGPDPLASHSHEGTADR